jgi:hypothetical protein
MGFVYPQHPWLARVMLVLGFVAIALLAFVGGCLVGTAIRPWFGG